MVRDVIVVGGGIIGATAAKALAGAGLDVLLLDDGRPHSGTAPSGGHLKPGWFGDLPEAEWRESLRLLDDTWGLIRESFSRPEGGPAEVFRVDTDAVLAYPKTAATVTEIGHLGNYPRVVYGAGEARARLLLVATGAWAAELVGGAAVTAKRGVSFRLRGTLDGGPFIRPWAPYKQVVAHQQAPGEVWSGDGSAILPRNWSAAKVEECLRRCLDACGLGRDRLSRSAEGDRPYCAPDRPGDPCLLRRLGPRAWLATGAGKRGTVAAGWVAGELLRGLKK